MSYRYWDYDSSTSPYWSNRTSSSSTSSSCPSYSLTGASNSTATAWAWAPKPRTILVIEPDHWSEENVADFIRLVNDETRTGWHIRMRIKGHIDITDPDVEVRSMADFIPLLRQRANAEDRQKIADFFDAHPPTAREATQ